MRQSTIKAILDERGIKYSHFAKKIGLPHAVAFHRIESGEQRPPDDYYEKAALFLNVDESRIRPEPAAVAS